MSGVAGTAGVTQNTAVELSFNASSGTQIFMAFRRNNAAQGNSGAYEGATNTQSTVTVSAGQNNRSVNPATSVSGHGDPFTWLVVISGTNANNGSATASHVGNTFRMDSAGRVTAAGVVSGELSVTARLKTAFDIKVYGSGATAGLFIGTGGVLCRGNSNVAIGRGCGDALTTGSNNTLIGRNCGAALTTATGVVAIGNAAFGSGTGSSNVGIGPGAGPAGGSSNVMIGNAAGGSVTSSWNVCLGLNAMRYVTSGGENVALGDVAAQSAGDGLTCIGATNGVFIGYDARPAGSGQPVADNPTAVTAGTNEVVLGYMARGGGSNTVTLGNTSITRIRGQVTSITSTSDRRIKENIQPANLDMCLDAVKAIPVRRWGWRRKFMGNRQDRHVTGFIADDVERIFPKSVDVQDLEFIDHTEDGEPIMHRVVISKEDGLPHDYPEPNGDEGDEVEEQPIDPNDPDAPYIKDEPETITIEQAKSLTMDQGLPTLWGAVQRLIQRVEELEAKVAT
jgi:hypothetical protein